MPQPLAKPPRPASDKTKSTKTKQPKPKSQRSPAVLVGLLATVAVAVLTGTGAALGAGIGVVAGVVRDALPQPQEEWLASKSAEPEPYDTTGPATACAISSLDLQLSATPVRFTRGQEVRIHVTVTNVGRRPCLIDGGLTNRQIVIRAADGATLWSSDYCEVGKPRELLIGPGEKVRHDLNWDGRMATFGNCGPEQPLVPAGSLFAQATLPKVAGATSSVLQLFADDEVAPEVTLEPVAPEPAPTPTVEEPVAPVEPGPEPAAVPELAVEAPVEEAPPVTEEPAPAADPSAEQPAVESPAPETPPAEPAPEPRAEGNG